MRHEIYVNNEKYLIEEEDIQEFEKRCMHRFNPIFLYGIVNVEGFDKKNGMHDAMIKAADKLNEERQIVEDIHSGKIKVEKSEGCLCIDDNDRLYVKFPDGRIEY